MQSVNGKLNVALIGCGGMGQGDCANEARLGAKIVAGCDIYTGRLDRMKEIYGRDLFTTRDYREVLARRDVDAVIIATPDHWHARISVDALNAGKHVYCQKPMVQKIEQAYPVIEAHKKSGKVFQVGSQYVSSPIYLKARELFRQGAIGELNLVEAWLDRNSAIGAWQYSIPTDASPATVDWDRFLGEAPKRPFEAMRLFRWRNYQDYGTGVAGDLFVHLFSGLHTVTGSQGPTRIYATGGIRYWNDGRDVPDVMLATVDYPKTETHPEFTLVLRVNFASGEPQEKFGFRFVGSEGSMTTSYNTLELAKTPREIEPGHTLGTFPKAVQEQFLRDYTAKYPPQRPGAELERPNGETLYTMRTNAHIEHHRSFQASILEGRPQIEDAVFGLRAAGPALLCNESVDTGKILKWDPVGMKRA
jgi:predicted dehydrogenase